MVEDGYEFLGGQRQLVWPLDLSVSMTALVGRSRSSRHLITVESLTMLVRSPLVCFVIGLAEIDLSWPGAILALDENLCASFQILKPEATKVTRTEKLMHKVHL